ncbi:MAG: ABC transporter substrate-binding protein [Hyphomicrobiales bacterium]|nr:ABC transporter substrate-binding protein [Hyphomicrobiales bacterium]
MDRRAFLKSAAGAGILGAAGIATPAIAQGAAARVMRLVPHADLANFDPIWTTAYIARNAGLLVWDTLYGVDAKLNVQRQMIETEEVSSDGLTWTFRLRPGLKFHDGEPVLAKDAVASIRRWAARDSMGQMLKAIEQELAAVDDRTFRWLLKKPYPKMLLALGKISTPCCFIMPARVAATDPYKQIGEYVGSGPMRFIRNDWVPGVKSAFEKFDGYVPRQEEASWMAGGKRIVADRIEWITMPDPATVAAALQTGEIDWWEIAIPDLVPLLRKNRNIGVDIQDPLGNVAMLPINHVFPPFNDARARSAILLAMSQEEYMRAYVGDDTSLWKPLPGYFTPGTPLYTEDGGDILKGPRKLDIAKQLLAESGYAGEPIVCMAAQDIPHHKAWGDVTVDLLKRLDLNVDFAAVDWGTVVARRAQKKPPSQGGWHMYHTSIYGVDSVTPTYTFLRADGSVAVNGWPNSPAVETETAAWFDATTPEEEKAAARRLNKAAIEDVVYAPLGWYLRYYAWRRTLTGVTQGPLPFFWGVSKMV